MDSLFSSYSDYNIFANNTLIQVKLIQNAIISIEKDRSFRKNIINKIYQAIHSVKISSELSRADNISVLMQALEDLFYYLWVKKPCDIDFSVLSVLVFEAVDYVRTELEGIKGDADGCVAVSELVDTLKAFLFVLNHEDIHITRQAEEDLYIRLSPKD
jgi:chemotaxis protein histidine kinase CheA